MLAFVFEAWDVHDSEVIVIGSDHTSDCIGPSSSAARLSSFVGGILPAGVPTEGTCGYLSLPWFGLAVVPYGTPSLFDGQSRLNEGILKLNWNLFSF